MRQARTPPKRKEETGACDPQDRNLSETRENEPETR